MREGIYFVFDRTQYLIVYVLHQNYTEIQGEAKVAEEEEEGTVTRGNPIWKATHITEISEELEIEEIAPMDIPNESSL